jgi:unsaturated chondroitin disaccharide hydrolase
MSKLSWTDAIMRMRARVDRTADSVSDGFPHFADPASGQWTLTSNGDWTGGYWNGILWLSVHATGAERYARMAANWTERLRPRVDSETSAKGLLFYYGAALGAILGHNATARELALAAARSLADMYNPRAKVIPMGSEFEEVHSVGMTETEVDVVQIAALLLWASRESGDARLREIALNHARRHVEFCLRPDGSICQSVSFDPATGRMIRTYTHKGINDHSTWARAQAWGMLGWALTAQWSGDATFLAPAERASDWWLAHVPADSVAVWDFDDPAIPNTNRDTSATAIAAASLLKLAALSPRESKRRMYSEAAEATVGVLVDHYLGGDGILRAGCFNKRIDLATKHELIWGDYYLYEALHVLAGLLKPTLV